MREWMLIAGAVLVLLLLADGVRRVLQDRRANMRLSKTLHDPIDNYLSELPNGGARVMQRDEGNCETSDGVSRPVSARYQKPRVIKTPEAAVASAAATFVAEEYKNSTVEPETASAPKSVDTHEGSLPWSDSVLHDELEISSDLDRQPPQPTLEVEPTFFDQPEVGEATLPPDAIYYDEPIAEPAFSPSVGCTDLVEEEVDDSEDLTLSPATEASYSYSDNSSDYLGDTEDSFPELEISPPNIDLDVELEPVLDSGVDSFEHEDDIGDIHIKLSEASLNDTVVTEETFEAEEMFEAAKEWTPKEEVEALSNGEQAELEVSRPQSTIIDVFDDLGFSTSSTIDAESVAVSEQYEVRQSQQYRANPFNIPEQQSFDLGGEVPILMDSLAENADDVVDLSNRYGFVPRKVPKSSPRSRVEFEKVPRLDLKASATAEEKVCQPAAEGNVEAVVEPDLTVSSLLEVSVAESEPEYEPLLAEEELPQVVTNNVELNEVDKSAEMIDIVEAELVDLASSVAAISESLDIAPSSDNKVEEVTPVNYRETASPSKTLFGRLASTLEDMPVFGKSAERSAPKVVDEVFQEAELMSQPEQAPSIEQDQRVEIINVRSKSIEGFDADKLHAFFKACDIQLSKNKIYLRHEQASGQGAVQFNVANLVDSGVFAPDDEGKIYIPGVCFYITLPGPHEPLTAFEAMLQTAEYLAKNLGGLLKDRAGSDINKQVLDYYRSDIREYCRKHLTI